MSKDEKKPAPPQPQPNQPAHSTQQEKERLKKLTKEEIPPGLC